MKQVCMLAINFYPVYPRCGTRYPLSIAQMLAKEGYKVTVVTTYPKSLDGRTPFEYRKFRQLLGDIEIIRVPTLPINRLGVKNKLVFYFSFMLSSLLALPFIKDVDVLLGAGPDTPFLMFTSFLYSRFTRSKHVTFLTDMFPDVLFDYKLVKNRLLKKTVSFLSILSYKLADHIVAITEDLKQRIVDYGIPKQKVSVIRLGVDTSIFHPTLKVHWKSTFVVLYSGSFSMTFDYETLLETAKLLQHKNILFVLLGDGETKQLILNEIDNLNLENMVLLPSTSSSKEVAERIRSSNLCVAPIIKGVNLQSFPSKLVEYMACGKPIVLGCSEGSLASFIRDYEVGIPVESGNPDALAEAITYLFENSMERLKMGFNGVKLAMNHFSYGSISKQLRKVVECVSSST